MAVKEYLDKAGVQVLWNRICEQDRDLLDKIIENSNKIAEIIDSQIGTEVYYDTSANWANQPNLISKRGVIYIYLDAKEFDGQILPRIKIGNGVSLLKDMYFIDQDIVHALNNLVTVTQEEKNKWNNKVTCSVNEETLVFSKD